MAGLKGFKFVQMKGHDNEIAKIHLQTFLFLKNLSANLYQT